MNNQFKYSDPLEQVRKVNLMLCISTAVVYLLTFTVVIVSVIQGNRSLIYAIGNVCNYSYNHFEQFD